MHRVVVTGVGPVSSIGVGARAFERGLRQGRSGIAPITAFDTTGFPLIHGGEVAGFAPEQVLRRLHVERWGRASLFAAAAARLAVTDAALDLDVVEPDRVAVVMGTTSGESQVIEQLAEQVVDDGLDAMAPALLERLPAGRRAWAASEELGVTGESVTLTTACSASNYALGYAYDLVANGDADVVVAGGADSICRWAHAGFLRLGAMAPQRCSPFDRDRAGMLVAEGGAALVVESADHARSRGMTPYAEILGYGVNCDARHMVAPDADSIAACIRLALADAGVGTADVDYVCAHGTGTPANDVTEARALRAVFGADVPPVSSIKSMLGHTMGAASGFGAIACALAVAHGFLPPTVNWRTPDPDMEWLDPVPSRARPAELRVVQNDGFAFGGNNAIVVLGAVA